MKRKFGMSIWLYIKEVLLPSGVVFALSVSLSYGLRELHLGHGVWPHIITLIGSVLVTALLSFYVGIKKKQRQAIVAGVKGIINNRKKK